MNKIHPFGLPIWKPALYKKSRSVVRKANRALHSSPSSAPELFLNPANILWFIIFGWWLALIIFVTSIILYFIPFGGIKYGRVLKELSLYLLWPFGRYVERQVEISPTQISGASSSGILNDNIQQHQDDEETGLLSTAKNKKRKHKSTIMESVINFLKLGPAGIIYYIIFSVIIGKNKLGWHFK
jgi:Ca2+:H+ antiporter